MVHGEVAELKNRGPVMAGVGLLEGDHSDNINRIKSAIKFFVNTFSGKVVE